MRCRTTKAPEGKVKNAAAAQEVAAIMKLIAMQQRRDKGQRETVGVSRSPPASGRDACVLASSSRWLNRVVCLLRLPCGRRSPLSWEHLPSPSPAPAAGAMGVVATGMTFISRCPKQHRPSVAFDAAREGAITSLATP